MAGAGASAVISEQLESQRRFGAVDLADLMDLQQSRPTVTLARRRQSRRRVAVDRPHRGPARPRRRADRRSGTVAAVARRARRARRCRSATGRAPCVHTRGIPECRVAPSSDQRHRDRKRRELVAEVGAWRSDFVGPTGAARSAPGDARPGRRPHRGTVGAGPALPGGWPVTPRDPGGARSASPSSAGSRPTCHAREQEAATSAGSRKACRSAPTSPRLCARSRRPPRATRRCRAVTNWHPRSNGSSGNSPEQAAHPNQPGGAGRRAGAGSARPAHQSE